MIFGGTGGASARSMNLMIKTLSLTPFALAIALGGCSHQSRENMGEAVEEPFEEIDEHTTGDESADEDDFAPDTES